MALLSVRMVGHWQVAVMTVRFGYGMSLQAIHQKTLTGHTDSVLTLTFNPNGSILASGSYDSTIRLWEYCYKHAYRKLSVVMNPLFTA